MQSETASMHSAGSVTRIHRKGPPSPYDVWYHIDALEQEAKRLSLLPMPYANVNHIVRWRRKQVWLIGLRIKELSKEPHLRGA